MDKTKYSLASKARWAVVPPEVRSKMMSKLAKRRHSLLTPEQRATNARNMVRARFDK